MQCTKLKTYMETGRVIFLPPSRIRPNPAQPRKIFSQESLQELAQSIRLHGILQPLSVRRVEAHYELIAGERRFRAAQLAGLRELPCIVMRMDDRESGLTALMENLQRQDLNFVEEARAYSRLMSEHSLSQEQVAQAVGKSQSAVANKLRLLRHSPAVLNALLEGGLTERHGRALLKLPDEGKKLSAISHITREHLSVAQTEQYVAALLQPNAFPRGEGGRASARSDEERRQDQHRNGPERGSQTAGFRPHSSSVSFADSFPPGEAFLSQLQRLVESVDLPITLTREESPTHITLTLRIPK